MPGGNWPCQKPPWGRLTAVNAATGDIAWQTPLGVTEQLPEGRQHTGRPALAGPIVTAGGLLFVASTDDNRFRAHRRENRPRTVDHQTRSARQRQSDDLSRQERQAIRRRGRHRHAGGLCAAVSRGPTARLAVTDRHCGLEKPCRRLASMTSIFAVGRIGHWPACGLAIPSSSCGNAAPVGCTTRPISV